MQAIVFSSSSCDPLFFSIVSVYMNHTHQHNTHIPFLFNLLTSSSVFFFFFSGKIERMVCRLHPLQWKKKVNSQFVFLLPCPRDECGVRQTYACGCLPQRLVLLVVHASSGHFPTDLREIEEKRFAAFVFQDVE
jgi:hypothetical protein